MRSLAILLVGAVAGCFSPSYPVGLACGTGLEPCPPGQTCGADQRCAIDPAAGHDGAVDDATLEPDAVEVGWHVETQPDDLAVHAVWASERSNARAVGAAGRILKRDATGAWVTEQALSMVTNLRAIDGRGPFVWVVGDGGHAAYFDGLMWTVARVSVNQGLIDVYAMEDGSAVAISTSEAFVYQPDAKVWTQLPPLPTGTKLTSVWVAAGVIVVGTERGASLQLGDSWTERNQFAYAIRDIASFGGETLYYVGLSNTIAFGNPNQISREELGAPGPWHALDGLGLDTFWAVGAGGATHRVSAATWAREPTPVELVSVDVVDSGLVLAVGVDGRIYRRTL